jgi:hypothetical protein
VHAHVATQNIRETSVPKAYRDHPRVKGQLFFVIPKGLLSAVAEGVGRDALSRECAELDSAVADVLEHDPMIVGYDDGRPISYSLLKEVDGDLPVPDGEWLQRAFPGTSPAEYRETAAKCGSFLRAAEQIRQDYAGWLMINPTFLRERDAFRDHWSDLAERHGTPKIGLRTSGPLTRPAIGRLTGDRATVRFATRFGAFCRRWRLGGLPTWTLPDPLSYHMGVAVPERLPPALLTSEELSWVPSIYPVTLGRNTDLQESRRCAADATHLEPWLQLTAPERPNDLQIHRFGRIFRLQHYWKVLADRHPGVLNCRTKLQNAFAGFFDVKLRTLQDDLTLVRKSVGLP